MGKLHRLLIHIQTFHFVDRRNSDMGVCWHKFCKIQPMAFFEKEKIDECWYLAAKHTELLN